MAGKQHHPSKGSSSITPGERGRHGEPFIAYGIGGKVEFNKRLPVTPPRSLGVILVAHWCFLVNSQISVPPVNFMNSIQGACPLYWA